MLYIMLISFFSMQRHDHQARNFFTSILVYLTHICIPCCLHRAIKILYPDFELLENSQPWHLEQNVTSPS